MVSIVPQIAGSMVARSDELWFNEHMRKAEAIELLGGSITSAANAIGISYQAVDKWPDELPPRIADRVYAALWKQQNGCAHAPRNPEPARAE